MSRLTAAAAHRTVEIENQVGGSGTEEVLRIEDVEDVDDRLDRKAAHVEVLRQSNIETVELVVLLAQIASGDRAVGIDPICWLVGEVTRFGNRGRLCVAIGVASVDIDAPGGVVEDPGIESVRLVAIRNAELGLEVVGHGVTERERITLVVVVGLVPRIGVVELELEVVR